MPCTNDLAPIITALAVAIPTLVTALIGWLTIRKDLSHNKARQYDQIRKLDDLTLITKNGFHGPPGPPGPPGLNAPGAAPAAPRPRRTRPARPAAPDPASSTGQALDQAAAPDPGQAAAAPDQTAAPVAPGSQLTPGQRRQAARN